MGYRGMYLAFCGKLFGGSNHLVSHI